MRPPRPTPAAVVTAGLLAAVLGAGGASAVSAPLGALPAASLQVTLPPAPVPAPVAPQPDTAVVAPLPDTASAPEQSRAPEPSRAPEQPAAAEPEPAASATGTLAAIRRITGADAAADTHGLTGKGVDVALIDTGVTPVPGLHTGNVIHGPDLSFDSQDPALTHLDGFGHGTHMAGLIVGRDVVRKDPRAYGDPGSFTGMAPDARLLSIKVGASDGAVDVTQVVAALHWVAQNGRKDGLNVRVVSLSYGTDSLQDYRVDPLAHALELVHARGITVVVAGGNDGSDKTYLGMPAQSPRALAVGGQDPVGTLDVSDDTVPAFANRGDHRRPVDLVAPAVSVESLRVPGSFLDLAHPGARAGERFFRGSGTSQAAAITAGAAALYLQKHPGASPAQVKQALQAGAARFAGGAPTTKGSGALDVPAALRHASHGVPRTDPAQGTGSFEASRGSLHVVDDASGTPVVLEGEKDVFGRPLDAATVATAAAAGTAWSAGGDWLGRPLTGPTWDHVTWRWGSRTWPLPTWAGTRWVIGSSGSWDGRSWSGRSWSGTTWTGRSWSGRSWSGRSWSGRSWSTGVWQ